ncbi:hypothetical protein [Streptomyces cuspidosporus]
MAERGETQGGPARGQSGAVGLPPNAPPDTARVVTGTTARQVNDQEARDFDGVAKVRDRGEVLGFGVPVVLFLPGVAYLGITNGHQFIANDFFAFMYCLASIGFASVPLVAWRRGGGRYADPGFVRSACFPWLFTTMQGVAYSSPRSDANVVMLTVGWGAFIYAGMVALYFLGRALWSTDAQAAVREAAPGEGTGQPKTGA